MQKPALPALSEVEGTTVEGPALSSVDGPAMPALSPVEGSGSTALTAGNVERPATSGSTGLTAGKVEGPAMSGSTALTAGKVEWYTVHTKPNHERQAELSLQRLGVETFYPQVKQRKVIRRKEQTVIGSLFPRYFFARLNLETHYRAATYARGVRNLVAFGSLPVTVDEEIIQGIRARLQDGYLAVPTQSFTPGEVVRIHTGLLQGLEAIFERELTDQQRAVLLLRTLAFQARVVVPLEQVVNA